jgi:hypothetical protein
LIVFGIGFLKYTIFSKLLAVAFIVYGVLFWLGNAGEIDSLLIIGDAFILITFCYSGYIIYNNKTQYSMQSPVYD